MPSFEVIGASVREQTGFEMIVFCPFVTVDQVEAWQEFSVSNAQTWLSESRDAARSAAEKARHQGRRAVLQPRITSSAMLRQFCLI
jgi:hypothetical protein